MEKSAQNIKQTQNSEHAYKKLMEQINQSLLEKYPNALKFDEEGTAQMVQLQELERIMNDRHNNQATNATTKGRGGNNVAENMKKSILSVLKKRLTPALYEEFEKRYIKAYELKSQKENFILYFLFLHEFLFQRKIQIQNFQIIKTEILSRVRKYVRNSQIRKDEQPQRKTFHKKNLQQFQKFLQIDLDFCQPRSYLQVREWIKNQYLKKKAVFSQAEGKVRRIIEKHPAIAKIFTDLHVEVKNESMSSNEQASSSNNEEIKLAKSESL